MKAQYINNYSVFSTLETLYFINAHGLYSCQWKQHLHRLVVPHSPVIYSDSHSVAWSHQTIHFPNLVKLYPMTVCWANTASDGMDWCYLRGGKLDKGKPFSAAAPSLTLCILYVVCACVKWFLAQPKMTSFLSLVFHLLRKCSHISKYLYAPH